MTSGPAAIADEGAVGRLGAVVVPWERVALGAILLLSAVLNVFQLNRVGLGNTYYAAAVKSMLQSWQNFFFVSFDPGGFVTIDKPPLAFWLQTASAKVFGFSGLSLLLPEALAGVLSVWLLYGLVARVFGRPAGLLAALALAVTPVAVLVDRSNLVESILVLTLLLAAWAALKAVETSRLRWMLLAAVFIGLGFNVKSLEAYLAAPAVFLVYLVGARVRWYERIWHLVLAAIVMLVVSLSWVTAVDLTPASQRPYVASSGNNSELNLALGYNGLGRLTGNTFSFLNGGASVSSTLSDLTPTNLGFTAGETGSPGLQRLINAQLGSQMGWLLLLAVIGFLAVLLQRRPRWPLDAEGSSAVLWGGWLATGAAFFSIAGFFHAYYLATLAPPIAALSGIGVVVLWREYRRGGWRSFGLPVALVLAALLQVHILGFFPAWNGWMTPLVLGATILPALVLAAAGFRPVAARVARAFLHRGTLLAAALAVVALLLTPFVWSEYTVAHASAGNVPSAGPLGTGGFGGFGPGGREFRRGDFRFPGPGGPPAGFEEFRGRFPGGFPGGRFNRGGPGGPDGGTSANPALVRYLEAHQGNARFLVATLNAGAAEPFILTTGKPVMDLGGFMGGDHILSTTQLASLVAKGTIRYFLVSGPGRDRVPAGPPPGSGIEVPRGGFGGRFGGGFGRGDANSGLTQWVSSHCSVVPSSAYGGSSTSSGGDFAGAQPLYDCGRNAASGASA